jgi:glyoxylase-like metal-dependent hydrolase (beta-lactamase superfamily II)
MTDYLLELIDLDQQRTGFRQFVSCWVYQADGLTFVVDPGPRFTIDYLVETLKSKGIKKIDYILLTHIHLDHAGGTAQVLDAFQSARVYCHEIGVKHIVNPEKLWQGSVQVLGELAELYGKPTDVPAEHIADTKELMAHGIQVLPTPGHASHHVSFLVDDILFAGETMGARVNLPSKRPYLRPATPPQFIIDIALGSLQKLRSLNPTPMKIAFAHYGLTSDVVIWCKRAQEQLVRWVDTLRALYRESPDDLKERLFSRLMVIDPFFGQGCFDELPEDIRVRERYFFANTFDGMLGFLHDLSRSP